MNCIVLHSGTVGLCLETWVIIPSKLFGTEKTIPFSYDMTFLTAIGLTAGGISTHLHTNTT